MSKRRKPSLIEPPTPAPPPIREWDPRPWLMGGLLALLVFLAYRPAARGAFIWDDDDYVAQNATLRTADGLGDIWLEPKASPQYYPMVFTTFWLEFRLWGDAPRGYHETNVLLHAASAILLWRILGRLRVPGAYAAAAVFAVHPVMVESVAWITERKNTLSMLFYLASAYAYLRVARVDGRGAAPVDIPAGGQPAAEPPLPLVWYGASLGFFLLALLSKTVTASLPAALVLVLWWKRRLNVPLAAMLIPFFALGVAGGVGTAVLEREHVGASGAEWHYSVAQRLLIAGRAVWFYAAKLLVPYKLTFVYPKWPVDPGVASQWLYPIAAVALVVALLVFVKHLGRGPLVGVLVFGGTLVPALGFVNVYPMRYTFVADHYQYHASAALVALVTASLAAAMRRVGRPDVARGVAIAVVAVLLVLTVRQASVYADRLTLWRDTTAKAPGSWMAWTNLGHAARAASPVDRATAEDAYRRALALAPGVADTHFNVAQLAVDDGRYADAVAGFRRTVEIEPRYADAYNMLGFCLRQTDRAEESVPYFKKAIAADPRHWRAMYNLARVQKDQGDLAEAAMGFQRGLEINPDQPEAYVNLADCLRRMGRFDAAILAMQELVRLHPENADAHWNLAALLRATGRNAEANAERAKAISLKPGLTSPPRGDDR